MDNCFKRAIALEIVLKIGTSNNYLILLWGDFFLQKTTPQTTGTSKCKRKLEKTTIGVY